MSDLPPRDSKVREYAISCGATIMLYPISSERITEGAATAAVIAGLKEIFGARRWPSMG